MAQVPSSGASYSQSGIPTVVQGLPSATGLAISTKNGSKPVFFFEGFVYAPASNMDLSFNNNSQPFMNFGVVAHSLHFGANTSIRCST